MSTIKDQKRRTEFPADDGLLVVEVRHDDECGNGHNTFSVTGTLYGPKRVLVACGSLHDEIQRHASEEIRNLVRWHLCSTDGPMHYVANARYWQGQNHNRRPSLPCLADELWEEAWHQAWRKGGLNDPPNVENLKHTIVYGAAPSFDTRTDAELMAMSDEELVSFLNARLPELLENFRKDVEGYGFKWGGDR